MAELNRNTEHPIKGHVYYLEDFEAPYVFLGLCFESTTSVRIVSPDSIIKNHKGHIKDWRNFISMVYKEDRFYGFY